MRPLLLLVAAACVAAAAAQVRYADSAAAPAVRRRRVRPRRPAAQQTDSQTLVPFRLQSSPPPSRQQFQSQPPAPAQQFRPAADFRPQFAPQEEEFRSPQKFAPAPPKPQPRPSPQPRPKPSAPRRSSSRFQPQTESQYADYAPEATGTSSKELSEDYPEDEPDRLAELLAVSTFKCDPSANGYYADDTVNCEVFHYCTAGVKHSWVCPNGNSFHQINLICQPQSADNICQRSNEFTFVNDYLYHQINNDTRKPQYADRYYPDTAASGDALLNRPAPQQAFQQRHKQQQKQQPQQRPQQQQEQQQRRRRPRPQTRPPPAATDFGPSGNGFGGASSSGFPDFRQAQAAAASRPTQGTRGGPKQSAFRPEQVGFRPDQDGFRPDQDGFRRSGEEPVLPPVRPEPYPGQGALRPNIRSRGVPQPRERHDDRIVLGGFQGNVDIEDLASRRGRQ